MRTARHILDPRKWRLPSLACLGMLALAASAASLDGAFDSAGRRASATALAVDSSLGSVGGLATAGSAGNIARNGFIARLFEVASLAVRSEPELIQQGATAQLNGSATLDDGTVSVLGGADIQWQPAASPLASINASGIATAANPAPANVATFTGTYLGVESPSATLLVNRPPVPSDPDAAGRFANRSVKILAQKLVMNDADADSDPLTLTAVSATSANGATLRITGAWVIYQPPTGFNDTDTFNYTVSDGRGGAATGTVTVIVQPDPGAVTMNVLQLETLSGSGYTRIVFVGIPGRTYSIQATDSLSPAAWTTLDTAVAGGDGIYEFVDTDAPNHVSRFYRSTSP